MQRLRIIAPLVVSTLYNVLRSDSGSGHFTQLCTHVCQESQFLAPLLIVKIMSATSPVCFYFKQQSSFISTSREMISPATQFVGRTGTHSFWCEASFTLPSVAVRGTTTYDDRLCSWIFFLCTPRWNELSHLLTHISHCSWL